MLNCTKLYRHTEITEVFDCKSVFTVFTVPPPIAIAFLNLRAVGESGLFPF